MKFNSRKDILTQEYAFEMSFAKPRQFHLSLNVSKVCEEHTQSRICKSPLEIWVTDYMIVEFIKIVSLNSIVLYKLL